MLTPPSAPLKRILGTSTTWLIGMGVAIGSGIFRSHGNVAATLQAPWLIVLAWLFGGAFVLAAGLITAELATRSSRTPSKARRSLQERGRAAVAVQARLTVVGRKGS